MSYRTFLLTVIIIVVLSLAYMLAANMNLSKEADECRLIAEQVFSSCEEYRLTNSILPANLLAKLSDGRTIFETVLDSFDQKDLRNSLVLSEGNRKITFHGSEIGLADVSALGLDGYDVYIDWHLRDYVVAYCYHPWENE
ncbi:MAG: hypothetical protein WC528_02885 [Patescibacteria group bacterium]